MKYATRDGGGAVVVGIVPEPSDCTYTLVGWTDCTWTASRPATWWRQKNTRGAMCTKSRQSKTRLG